jgi:DNA-directed RNA polymerase specialized sigma24 family protein
VKSIRNILRSELQELPPGLRVVFVLRDIEGLSTEQTSEVLELTSVAVKARLCRARLQLRGRLSRYFSTKGNHNLEAALVESHDVPKKDVSNNASHV